MEDKIFLLSIEEYKKYKNIVPLINSWWWLRSASDCSDGASYMITYSGVYYDGYYVNYVDGAVRPALSISTEGYNIGDRLITCGYTWIIIDKDLVIAEMPISFRRFDIESNNYENSEIRKFLLEWYKERNK